MRLCCFSQMQSKKTNQKYMYAYSPVRVSSLRNYQEFLCPVFLSLSLAVLLKNICLLYYSALLHSWSSIILSKANFLVRPRHIVVVPVRVYKCCCCRG